MKLLVIGGTLFLGRHVVEAALARGWQVTMFNRGRTAAGLFPEVECLHGDRDGGLEPLRGRRWDAVVDTCGYYPRIVRQSAELLADAVGHYTFVSSMSVYPDVRPGDESAPVATLEDPTVETVNPDTYGGLKALSEQAVEAAMPGRALHLRAGMIIGRYDSVRRLEYWLRRIAEGGEVLVVGSADQPVQVIDAQDIAEWNLRCIEARTAGAFNVTGPVGGELTFGGLLDAIRAVTGSDARFTWADNAFAESHGLSFDALPYGLPEAWHDFFRRDVSKAAAAGLTTRPLEETLRDTWAWLRTDPVMPKKPGMQLEVGIDRGKERALLDELHKRSG